MFQWSTPSLHVIQTIFLAHNIRVYKTFMIYTSPAWLWSETHQCRPRGGSTDSPFSIMPPLKLPTRKPAQLRLTNGINSPYPSVTFRLVRTNNNKKTVFMLFTWDIMFPGPRFHCRRKSQDWLLFSFWFLFSFSLPPPPLPADCYDACVSSGTCSTIRYTIEGTRTRGAWSVELPWRLSTSMTLGMYTLSSSSQHFFFFFLAIKKKNPSEYKCACVCAFLSFFLIFFFFF